LGTKPCSRIVCLLPLAENDMADGISVGSSIGPLAFSGDTLDIGEMIGSGATANVYACTRRRTGEQLAVKVIDAMRMKTLENSDQALQRLEVEVQALRDATHERCLGLKDIYRTKRWVCIVMERLRGGELFDQIINRRRLSEFEARYVFRQVVEGLMFLHSRNIAHRDIKPENILVVDMKDSPPPDVGTLIDVKIADFGLSKLMAISQPTSMVGTPQYWAPEVLDSMGENPYDQRADLWSLGATLYVMLRGQYPFKGDGLNEKIRTANFDMSGAIWSQISEDAKDLIRKLLRVNPAERLSLEDCLQHPWMGTLAVSGSSDASSVASVPRMSSAATPTETSAIVKWEDTDALHVGGDGSGQAFSLKELVKLQVSLVSSLEMVSLLCRQNHPHLAADVSKVVHQASSLLQNALTVVKSYHIVAKQVNQQVLPDLQLAVQEAEPSLALELLDVVQKWVTDMGKDGDSAQQKCVELSQSLQKLINEVQRVRRDPDGDVQMDSGGYPDAPSQHALALRGPQMTTNSIVRSAGGVNTATRQLLDGLAEFAASYAAGDNQGTESVTNRRSDLLDLLFLAPGVQRPVAVTDGQVCSGEGRTGSVKRSIHDGAKSSGSTVVGGEELQLVPHNEECGEPIQRTRTSEDLASPLLQALRELRRVSEILMECTTFWTNMGGTVKELSRTKDHTQSLLKFASKSTRLRERFESRLGEYAAFWDSLMRLCDRYCKEIEPVLTRLRLVMSRAENLADVADTARAVGQGTIPMQQTVRMCD